MSIYLQVLTPRPSLQPTPTFIANRYMYTRARIQSTTHSYIHEYEFYASECPCVKGVCLFVSDYDSLFCKQLPESSELFLHDRVLYTLIVPTISCVRCTPYLCGQCYHLSFFVFTFFFFYLFIELFKFATYRLWNPRTLWVASAP